MKKYNIAFIPKFKSEQFLSLTKCNKLSSHNYCLGKDSLPHVTICQFFYEANAVESLWNDVCNDLDEKTISLSFKEYSNISFGNNLYWVSLLPKETTLLDEIFKLVSNHVKPVRSDKYDPHLTLYNYKKENSCIDINVCNKELFMEDDFEIILGESDDIGQLKNILFNSSNYYLSKTFN